MTDNSNPLVSIVIPVYNGSNYMREAIDSALAQTYDNIEVLVINDGSSDNGATRDIALSYGDKIRYFEKENGGVATALNLGIREMKGKFFSWLSHDDLYYPDKIEKQVEFYKQVNPGTVIFSHEDFIDSTGTVIHKSRGFEVDEERLVFRLLYERFIGGCSLLIPRIAFDDAGNFSDKYKTVQDYDMWFRMMNKGYKFKYLSITSGMSRIHENQDSNRLKQTCIDEMNSFFIDIQDWLDKDLWLNKWGNKAECYFYLARKYRKSVTKKVYLHNLLKMKEEALLTKRLKSIKYLFLFYLMNCI